MQENLDNKVNESVTPMSEADRPTINSIIQTEQPKQSNFLIILLSSLLFISVIIAGFFAYQTQQLVKELQMMKSEQKQMTEPTSESVATPDPTADWKTYSFLNFNFTLKYPSESAALVEESKDNLVINFYPSSEKSFSLQSRPSEGLESLVTINTPEILLIDDQSWSVSKIPTRTSDFGYNVAGNGPFYILQTKADDYLYLFVVSGNQLNDEHLQILSTFKFVN